MDFSKVDNIIRINQERNIEQNKVYNPITGQGSLIERFELKLTDMQSVYLPILMKDDPFIKDVLQYKTLLDYSNSAFNNYSRAFNIVLSELQKLRFKYDFEFWAFTTIMIKHKQTGKDAPFKLNRPQRKLLKKLMTYIVLGNPIRIIIGKARQWGGSTLVQFFFVWIQLFIKEGWSSCIVADVEGQARNVRGMIKTASKNYPTGINEFRLSPFENSNKNLVYSNRNDCVIYIGSMQQPDSIRSSNIYLAHLTEVGVWKKTKGKMPEDVIQTISGSVTALPYTAIVIESTAKGVGNYFYNQYQSAKNGTSEFAHFFASWFDNEASTLPITESYEIFIQSLNDYEQYLFKIGATLEQINWYRFKQRTEYSGSQEMQWKIYEEMPSDDSEMFQASGSRVFPRPFVVEYEKMCRPPKYVGDVRGDDLTGELAIENVEFVENPQGNMKVWVMPELLDTVVTNRYVVVVDIGGKSIESDNSVITVLDNLFTFDGGIPEICATWVGHIDQDVLAWKSVQICKMYHDALLVIENNSLDKEEVVGTEGIHFETVLHEIVDYYDNIYCTQQNIKKIREGLPAVYGFNTNKSTKSTIINFYYKCLRDKLYYEYELELCSELDTYELKPDGTYGARDKCRDDRLMTRAIGLFVCYNDAPKPEIFEHNKTTKKKKGGMTNF